MARRILLSEWAKEEFGDPVPGITTLNKYAKNGMISPPPVKVGRSWRVDVNARFVGMTVKPVINKDDSEILKRILSDGQTA
ncbi:excisionase [Salmonella enterica]